MPRRPRTPPTTPIIAFLLLIVAGCSEPPRKEIDQAQAAVDLARTAGAETYAAEEYTGAVAGLQKARTAVDERDYRQALSYAIDARQRAQNAGRQAAEGKARAQRAADGLIADTATALTQLQARLTAAAAARRPVKELRAARVVIADAQTRLQEARTEIGAGNYEKAGEILTGVRRKLDAAIRELENIPPRPRTTRNRPRNTRTMRKANPAAGPNGPRKELQPSR